MGQKDYQQLFLIKKFIKNRYKSKIVMCRTIRDKNKLALSSRNFLLNKKNYFKAGLIAKYLFKFRNLSKQKYVNNYILKKTKVELKNKFKIIIEYLEFRNVKDLKIADFRKEYRFIYNKQRW